MKKPKVTFGKFDCTVSSCEGQGEAQIFLGSENIGFVQRWDVEQPNGTFRVGDYDATLWPYESGEVGSAVVRAFYQHTKRYLRQPPQTARQAYAACKEAVRSYLEPRIDFMWALKKVLDTGKFRGPAAFPVQTIFRFVIRMNDKQFAKVGPWLGFRHTHHLSNASTFETRSEAEGKLYEVRKQYPIHTNQAYVMPLAITYEAG
jgi:hypothetical protein